MPKVRLTADDRRNDFVRKKRRMAKAEYDRPNYVCATDLGILQHTLSYKLKDAVKYMRLNEFIYFANRDRWDDEEIVNFVRGRC